MNDIFVDDVARAMTDVEAPADLRARVLAGLVPPQSRRWTAAVLPLAAAASIVAAGVVAMRPVLTEHQMPAVPRPSFLQLAATDPAPLILAVSAAAARARRTDAPTSADELAWLSRRLPPLETRALTVEPIQPIAASIAPISVEPIALEPISVPAPGTGSGDRR